MAPVEEASVEEEIHIEDDEDVEPLRMAKDPKLPSPEDVELHERMHVPYRDWCNWCNMGRGRGTPHRHTGASTAPIVGVDYFFLTKGGVHTRKELELAFSLTPEGETELEAASTRGELVKYLLVRCFQQKAVFSHLLPQKGLDEKNIACDFVLQDLEWLGHTRVIMKSDNEPAIQALVARVVELAKIECKDFVQ